ncbi:uncharacterized protein LOC131291360 [Anopheles ziemanni]|uniref:uncharacterized protein LOC131269445 n=1 Tax=Anopheles coustani TaxID=139045 RepID=UPI002657B144|nr:uncharacterized protein LOC131269445 [Anopheles coustani]XP_058176544.1 uncharacterized protein LOC131291360 [Anopheles ziemanni]
MKHLLAGFGAMCVVLVALDAARIKIPAKSRNDDLFSEDEFTFPVEDKKDPTNFTGNVMRASIVMAEVRNQGKGKFKYAVETENGIEIEQIGKLKNDSKTFVVMGSYTYTGANGKRYRVRYTADEFGYHPITELDLDIPDLNQTQRTLPPIKFTTTPRTTTTRRTTTTTTTTTTEEPTTEFQGYHYERPDNGYLPPNNDYLPPQEPEVDYLPPREDPVKAGNRRRYQEPVDQFQPPRVDLRLG